MTSKEIGGISIEAVADRGAEKRRRQMLHRERDRKKGPIIRVVDHETLEGPLSWPKLFPRDRGEAAPGFNRVTGKVGIPVWREPPVEEEEGRRFLRNAGRFEQFTRPGERKVDFNDLPGRLAKELVVLTSDDIDSASSQTTHIIMAYSGEEALQLDKVWRKINQAWDSVLKRQVNRENLDQLKEATDQFLREVGLTRARKVAKVNIKERFSKFFVTDSLDRLNPLVQRVRLRSAFLETVGLETFSILVKEKFSRIWAILMLERETTRQSLAAALESLDTMMGFTKRGASVFEGKQSKERETEG